MGNCWLIAALACVAEFPELIESLFDAQERTADGRYVICLFHAQSSKWEPLTIDNTIPCQWHGGYPSPVGLRPSGHAPHTPALR